MPKSTKAGSKKRSAPARSARKQKESSQYDRGPGQKSLDRDAVKSAEETRHITGQQGAIK